MSLSVYQKRQVLHYHIVYGYGAKRIISTMKREGRQVPARNTIRKYIKNYERILKAQGKAAADEYCSRKDAFNTPERKRTKLDKPACDYIEACLESNARKKAENNRKQCVYLEKVWRELRDVKGYDICYSTVTAYARDYIMRKEAENHPKSKECFIRQYHPAGEECQFDWGEVKLVIDGKKIKVRIAVFALPHSNYRRAYLFLRENTLAFLEAHRNFFHDIGRLPRRMVYDNMKVAVRSFTGTEKEPTEALLRLCNFYELEYRFCNARRGNEKGVVEESVKVIRPEAFALKDSFSSLEEAQAWLDKACDALNHRPTSCTAEEMEQLVDEDFAAMRPCKDDLACFRLEERQVNKYGVIGVERAYYSVPDDYTLQTVNVRIFSNKLEVLNAEGSVIAGCEKIAPGDWHIELGHYLHTLSYKPGALKNSVALRQAPEPLQRMFSTSFINRPKDFVELLLFAKDKGKTFDDVIQAYQGLRRLNVKVVSLQLMKSALMAEECDENVQGLILSQDSVAIEKNAEKGMESLTAIMGVNTNTGLNYASYGR